MIRQVIRAALVAALVASLPIARGAAGRRGSSRQLTGDSVTSRGSIDWDRGTLFATGLGAISNREPNEAKAYLRARTYAKLDALRNLLMVVDHVKIDSRTTAADFESASDVIRAEVHGIVRGAQVVGERKLRVGNSSMVEVTVATPLYGDAGIARLFVPEIVRRDQEAPIRSAEPSIPEPSGASPAMPEIRVHLRRPAASRSIPVEPAQINPDASRPYTSLIVDTRGLAVDRCMSPKIRRPDGSEVWGTVNADLNFVIEHGIVVYAHTLAEARRLTRAGDNPLVVRAVGRAGGRFNSDAVLSESDAERILRANDDGRFLDSYRVIFIVDPAR